MKNAPKATFDPKTGVATYPIAVKPRYQQEYRSLLINGAVTLKTSSTQKPASSAPRRTADLLSRSRPNEVTFGFTEGNSWQYSFFVPHDVTRLMELMGGREKFIAKLDELFTTDQKLAGREQADLTGLIGQYAHGNEPSHHIAYLYNYAGEPWKTQKYVRQIMDDFYKNAARRPDRQRRLRPDVGVVHNDRRAASIRSHPGDGIYALGDTAVSRGQIQLENGKTFTVRAKNLLQKNVYVSDVRLNGSSHKKAFITHADIARAVFLNFR